MTEKELTAKEKKRLKMVALGDTAQEIAEREYRSVHSINKCIEKKEMKEIKNIPKPPKYEDEED